MTVPLVESPASTGTAAFDSLCPAALREYQRRSEPALCVRARASTQQQASPLGEAWPSVGSEHARTAGQPGPASSRWLLGLMGAGGVP